jgi:crossover junction endodeoxyribonuclease RusA
MKARKYKFLVQTIALKEGYLNALISRRLSIRMQCCPPNKRKIDIDNRIKIVLDSLEACGVFKNDEQIDEIFIARGPITVNGKMIVEIEEIT